GRAFTGVKDSPLPGGQWVVRTQSANPRERSDQAAKRPLRLRAGRSWGSKKAPFQGANGWYVTNRPTRGSEATRPRSGRFGSVQGVHGGQRKPPSRGPMGGTYPIGQPEGAKRPGREAAASAPCREIVRGTGGPGPEGRGGARHV